MMPFIHQSVLNIQDYIFNMNYGNEDKQQLITSAAQVATACAHNHTDHIAIVSATTLLLETACAETLMGNLKDPTPNSAGTGITQVDEGTFNWLKRKYESKQVADAIKGILNIDLASVKYNELATNNVLAFLFCRLRYMTVVAPIPDTLAGRAAYWKEYYNTKEGAGTVQEYINKATEYLGY